MVRHKSTACCRITEKQNHAWIKELCWLSLSVITEWGSTIACINRHIKCARCVVSASHWVVWGHRCDVKLGGRARPEDPVWALLWEVSLKGLQLSLRHGQTFPHINGVSVLLMLNYCIVCEHAAKKHFYFCVWTAKPLKSDLFCLLCGLDSCMRKTRECNCILLTTQDDSNQKF